MIVYSPRAQLARSFLQQPYNDLDVFVEDTRAQNVYVRLVNRALGGKRRISSVFPLGPRGNVLARCKADQAKRKRKRLYIIDGDLDLLLGRRAPRLKHLHRLAFYSVENLLCNPEAALQLATEAKPSTPLPRLHQELRIQEKLEAAAFHLTPLFVAYGVAHYFGLGLQTTSFPVARLCLDASRPTTISPSLVRQRLLALRDSIRAIIPPSLYRPIRNRAAIALASPPDRMRHLAGKHLFIVLQAILIHEAGVKESGDSLKVRFSAICPLNVCPGLTKAIRKAAGIRRSVRRRTA